MSMLIPMRAIPPISPPIASNFSWPYMCSSSGGLSEALVAINSTNVVNVSKSACSPSLMIARLPTIAPKDTSTRTTLDIAIVESLRTPSLRFSGVICINNLLILLNVGDLRIMGYRLSFSVAE